MILRVGRCKLAHFGELIDAARAAPVAITKYDRTVVVMVAAEAEEFERMMALRGRKKYSGLGP